jgi:hypothetical protein
MSHVCLLRLISSVLSTSEGQRRANCYTRFWHELSFELRHGNRREISFSLNTQSPAAVNAYLLSIRGFKTSQPMRIEHCHNLIPFLTSTGTQFQRAVSHVRCAITPSIIMPGSFTLVVRHPTDIACRDGVWLWLRGSKV